MKPSGLLSIFILLVKKVFRQRCFHKLIRKFFIVVPFAMQNYLVFKDGSLEVVGNVRLVRIQSIWIVNCWLLMYTSTLEKIEGKMLFTWVTRRTGTACSSSAASVASSAFASSVSLFTSSPFRFRNRDPWQVSVSKPSMSVSNQRSNSDPFGIQPCIFHRVRWSDKFPVRGTTTHRQLLGLSLQHFQQLPQKVGTENYSTWLRRNVCKNVSSWPTGLFCRLCWNDSTCNHFPATTTQLFYQSLSSHTLRSCREIFSISKNICNSWHSNFQKVSTHSICSRDDIFTQKGNCGSPNNLCKCTESPSTLSTNTSIVWNLYLSWSNHLVTSFRLEMKVGGFSEHQNKTSNTDRYKGYFFTTGVSQVNVNTVKIIFEQWSELQVAKCLIVHVLTSS